MNEIKMIHVFFLQNILSDIDHGYITKSKRLIQSSKMLGCKAKVCISAMLVFPTSKSKYLIFYFMLNKIFRGFQVNVINRVHQGAGLGFLICIYTLNLKNLLVPN